MSILSSKIIEDRIQIDGRRHVTEEHTTDDSRKIHVNYMAEDGADVETRMTDRVHEIEDALIEEEAVKAEQELIAVVTQKDKDYFLSLTDAEVKTDLGLTDEELEAFKKLKE